MKYTLIQYNKLKLLVNELEAPSPLISRLPEIEALAEDVKGFYSNLLTASDSDVEALESKQKALIEKIGYQIIGVPFTHHDAELYALDKKLAYDILEIHGNTGKANASKEEVKDSHIQMRVTQAQKSAWVKQAQAKKMKLTEWITKKLNDDLWLAPRHFYLKCIDR